MTEIELDFEEPPPIARRSPYLDILLALKGHPGKSVRIEKDRKLSPTEANALGGTVQRAAAKIGDGYEVVTRFIPATDHHGVWVTYKPAPDDEPGIPTAEARAAAKADIDEAMTPAYRKNLEAHPEVLDAIKRGREHPEEAVEIDLPIPAESTEVDDAEWEMPERTGARS